MKFMPHLKSFRRKALKRPSVREAYQVLAADHENRRTWLNERRGDTERAR